MRILLDESTPRGLKRLLEGHEVQTVPERGWASMRNGELLALAMAEFDVFVTADQDMPHQQNLSKFDIAVIVLAAGRNRIATYEPLAEGLRRSVEAAKKGESCRGSRARRARRCARAMAVLRCSGQCRCVASVAKRRAIDQFRRQETFERKLTELGHDLERARALR